MKRNHRSALTLALAVMMLLSMVIVPIHAEGTVALQDPGFEGSIWSDNIWSYWIPDGESWDNKQVQDFLYSSDTSITPVTDGGLQCIKFWLSDAGSFYITQTLTNVPAGTYTLTAQAQGAGGETVEVVMGDMVGDVAQSDSGWNVWATAAGTFTLSQDCAELIVGVKVTCTAGGWGYIDNLALTPVNTQPTPPEKAEITLPNGDFELGNTNNWILSGYSEVAQDQWAENNGTYALSLWLSDSDAANGSASYSVALTAGTYQFSFDLSGAAMDSGLSYAVTAGETELVKGNTTYTTGGWDVWQTETTGEFTLTADTKVTFTLSGTQPAGYFGDLDNLKLYGTGALAEVDPEPVEADIYVPYIKGTNSDFIRGMDVSSLLSILNSGATFKDWDGIELDGQGFMNLLAESGTNWIRLRVWVDPFDAEGNGYGGGNNDVEAAKIMGKWATNAGMKVLIDFHYSDFWADPGKQQAPKGWANQDIDSKEETVYQYTYTSLETLLDAGVDVGMVQVGNETTSKFCGESNWTNICRLFNSGSEAIREISNEYNQEIKVAIHFTNPERSGSYASLAKRLSDNNVDYDVFASSWYPYWHGTLDNLTSVLKNVADTYGKEVLVAETSWAYTLEDGDGHDNTVRKNNNDSGNYDYSAQGQATEITDVVQAVRNVGDAGVGVFYWEPAWIPVQVYDADAENASEVLEQNKALWEKYGSGWASSYAAEYDPNDAGVWYGGSAWDNQALFDFEGNPLESLKTYLYMQTGTSGFEIYVTGVESPTLTYTVGDTLVLPETLTVSYSFGSDQTLSVTWDAASVAAVDMNTPGTYTVTGTVDGNPATCSVVVMNVNLLRNPGMEESDMSMYTISQAYARRKTDDPHSGSYSMHFYNSGVVNFTAEQTVTLQPGHYVFSLFGQGGDLGTDAETYAYVKIGDTTLTEDFALTGWAIWVNPTIEFDVTEETDVTVGINVTASQNGAWGTFDDWYLCENHAPTHSGGTATCVAKAECAACGETYGELDADNHHGGTATCSDQAVCEDCEQPYGELDADNHHGGTATCSEKAVCEDCEQPYGEQDADNHHDGTATCSDQAVCEDCGEPYGELDADNHAGGTEIRGAKEAKVDEEGYTGDTHCLGCGEKLEDGEPIPKKEAPKPSDPSNPDTGDSTPILMMTVLMLLSGATVVTLLRKREIL